MTKLVADVGGTNTRVALLAETGLSRIARFENDRFASFDAVLSDYLRGHELPHLTGGCVAVAGPVTEGQAVLTNRDWHFGEADLGEFLGADQPVRLVNDLVALGHALPDLKDGQIDDLRPASTGALNDQALVVGLGTGVNVCVLKERTVAEAELGHASLPSAVTAALAAVGEAGRGFDSNESLFSGRGLSRLHRNLTGQERRGQDILADFDTGVCENAKHSVELIARLLGHFARELVFLYLPFRGIHFAGGAARGILTSSARSAFLQSFQQEGPFAHHLDRVPIRLISDDTAALTGAARLLTAGARQ